MEAPTTITEESDDQSSVKSDESCGSNRVKFLCRYGGRILPRPGDGKLRYAGGGTRVLAVSRSIAFADLIAKMSKVYNSAVLLKCQLPGEDLDALVSVKSDEDLANMLEEYDKVGAREGLCKVRAFLFLLPISARVGKPPAAAKMDGRPSAEAVIVKSVKPQNDSHVAVSVPNHYQISHWLCSPLSPKYPVNQLTRRFHANRQHSSGPLARKAGLHVGRAFAPTCGTAVLSGISTR